MNIIHGKDYENELKYSIEVYGSDIDVNEVRTEAFVLSTVFQSVEVDKFEDILQHIRTVSYNERKLIPSICNIINLILVNPATSCTPGRSFSTARRLKTWLRSTMKCKRFNNLGILLTHKEMTDDINLVTIGNEFISKHAERKLHLGQFVLSDFQH